MNSPGLSPFIPDLGLITLYAERQESFLSRVSPWTKAALLGVLIAAVTIVQDPAVILGLYLAVLALYAAARLPLERLPGWYAVPLIFVLSLVGILAWSQPGTPVISLAPAGIPLALTFEGIGMAVTLSVKTLVTVTFSLTFLMTTRYEHLAGMIGRIFPAPMDQIFLMAYRYFFLTLSMIGAMLMAFRSRGGGLVQGLKTQGALLAGIFGLVFIRSLDRAERVERAMAARGYHGSYTSLAVIPRPTALELGALSAFTALITAAALWAPKGVW